MSNGVWVSSAWAATRKSTKPMIWGKTHGRPMPSHPKIDPGCCALTIPCRLIVPAIATTPTPADPAGIDRTETALQVRHHLQQEDVPEDDGAEGNDGEHDDRLDRQDRPPAHVDREPHHRSMSPRMKYSDASTVITSGTYTPRRSHGRIDTLLNDAQRIFTRNGPVAPLGTT